MTEPTFTKLTDLAAERLGGKAILCSDDFFAGKENLLKPGRESLFPINTPTVESGWMDGDKKKKKPGT